MSERKSLLMRLIGKIGDYIYKKWMR